MDCGRRVSARGETASVLRGRDTRPAGSLPAGGHETTLRLRVGTDRQEISPESGRAFQELHRVCLVNCLRCRTGVLIPGHGRFGAFFGCSNCPRCTPGESACSWCRSPMSRQGRSRLCTNAECNREASLCSRCGGDMELRNGRFGDFWGCIKYHGNESMNCHYVKSIQH